MKTVSILLCLCFSLNVLAASNIEAVYNDYQYAMTVEWDQKDLDFKNAQTSMFYENVDSLVASGLTSTELMTFVESKVSNKAALAELKAAALNAGSTGEVLALVDANADQLFAQGANWSGSAVLRGAIITTISALFVYSIYFTIKHGCMESENGGPYSSCNDRN